MIEDVLLNIEYSETKNYDIADLYIVINGKNKIIATRIGNDYIHSIKNRVELTPNEREELLKYVLNRETEFDVLNFLSDYFEQYRNETDKIMMLSLNYAKEKARDEELIDSTLCDINKNFSENKSLNQIRSWLTLTINENAEKYSIYIDNEIEESLYDILTTLVAVNVKNNEGCGVLSTINLITNIIFNYCFRYQIKVLTYTEVIKAFKSQSRINLVGIPIVIDELINKQMQLTSRRNK